MQNSGKSADGTRCSG